MGRAVYKVKGGKMIKVQLDQREGKIKKVKIMGDFFLHPEDLIEEMEKALTGSPVNEENIRILIDNFLSERGGVLLGASSSDIAKCIVMAGDQE